ncbi:MAG: LapA family protein [Calditrichaeota bacterium]|nr:LapA family protein [Calditrichota bacterium]
MWIIRWTFIAIIMLAILGFSLQNSTLVNVKIWTWESQAIPVYLVLYAAFALGIIVAAMVAAVNQVSARVALHKAHKEIRALREEVDRLRTVTLDEELMLLDSEEEKI